MLLHRLLTPNHLHNEKDTTFIHNQNCKAILKKIPIGTEIVNGKKLYKMKVETQHYNYFAPTVWFDPDIGAVRILSKSSKCEDRALKVLN